MEKLDPRSLEVFLAVVETGSATLAGRRLLLTQPRVTQAISMLEARTGMVLFERGRFGMRPTAEGELFAQAVRQSFSGLDRVAAAADAIRQGSRGQVVVTSFPVYADGFVAEALGLFTRENPEMAVRINVEYADEIVRQVLHGEADLGITPGHIGEHAHLTGKVLGQRRLHAIMSADHPLANHASVGISELAGVELVNYGPHHPYRPVVVQAFARMAAPITSRIEAVTQLGAARLALSSGTVALIDDEVALAFAHARVIPFSDSPDMDVSVLWSRERPVTIAQAAVLKRLEAAFRQIAPRIPGAAAPLAKA